ncbi:MFS transporter [Mycobacterium sp. KBS0706]|uniref:MFS transporter n=1 Tax=Mycobacterium sp. KBS0706 TaxID=2578109 RepID=UPI00110FE8A5|nr:MFS transporter [Mycobacterium sp. KBS0706]TSD89177.1 MFS transporter [Mycobacterium sp. KBS0706]
MAAETPASPDVRAAIPRGVWMLGFVSLFMDVSSEMIHALLPVFLLTTVGASAAVIGLIEGVAEATASIVKVFSGVLSDWFGRRKLLAVIGYGLGALSKPLFPLAGSAGLVLAARFVDRIGKGIRGAPRDALVADLTPPAIRGAAFGLRQSLDTVGAFAGPLLAIGLMLASGGDIQLVFWLAVIPAAISVAILVGGVHEPDAARPAKAARSPIRRDELRRLGGAYWRVVAVAAVLTLARFSEAFLVLKAQEAGLALALVPLVLVVMNVAYALSAYPVGVLSDRHDPKRLLVLGFAVLVAADLVLALDGGLWAVLAGTALWGLHMGMTQGLLAALVAETVPADRRGTGFGLFNLAGGLALLLASALAGGLWTWIGSGATFLAGAGLTVIGLAGAVWLLPRRTAVAAQ